ncbi:MAG: beta-galactosidase [Luteolibacter sp.]
MLLPEKIQAITINLCLGGSSLTTAQESPYRYWPTYQKSSIENTVAQKWNPQDTIKNGWDFSLPPSVTVSPQSYLVFSRIFSLTQKAKLPPVSLKANPVLSIWFSWKEVEPAENQYDFAKLRSIIDMAATKGYGIEIRPLTAIAAKKGDREQRSVPDYVAAYATPILTGPPEKGDRISHYDPTHPDFHQRYLKFVEAFGKSGIAKSPNVKSIVVGYSSPSFGDEGIGPHGMDWENEPKHVKERLDAWAKACEGVTNKVMMCGDSAHGFSKGFGTRGGFVENYMYRIPEPSIGQFIDSNGYLSIDETAPVIEHRGLSGEENEEYDEKWAGTNGRFGKTTESFPYRYFSSTLRSIQMRVNTILLNPFSLYPELTAYLSLQMGRTVSDTPDVWCFLRENQMRGGTPCKNYERWLYQRDSAGYETEAVLPVPMPVRQWMIANGRDTDLIARAGKKIGFAVDDRFLPETPQPVTFKITFYDGVKGTLNLVYQNGAETVSYPIVATGEDTIRTATVHTTALFKSKAFAYDFEIQSPEKVPVCIVRVIKNPKDTNP